MENNLETTTQKISNNFKEFLFFYDPFIVNLIGHEVSYVNEQKSFKIEVKSLNEGFNSQKYFMYHFETEKGQEKLSKFKEENNVGFVVY
jgi:hypothetical protein